VVHRCLLTYVTERMFHKHSQLYMDLLHPSVPSQVLIDRESERTSLFEEQNILDPFNPILLDSRILFLPHLLITLCNRKQHQYCLDRSLNPLQTFLVESEYVCERYAGGGRGVESEGSGPGVEGCRVTGEGGGLVRGGEREEGKGTTYDSSGSQRCSAMFI